ncbi:MAG TPA: PEP-CTERM sorting domain-containing protein [Candidatus Baltobacteraceae bacterium]|nr:PEP-CTERM sorting domain-containing protein [Candidatus Baltobacteraceae bacterium]
MKIVRISFLAIVAASCALLLTPGNASADTLTGTTGISWIAGGSTFASDTIAVGSSLNCPGASPICVGYSGFGTESFSVGTDSITYSVSDFPVGDYGGGTNGFEFTGLTFASGDELTGFTIVSGTNTVGVSPSDITITPTSIFINLNALPIDGTFTIDLLSGPVAPTPEPSSLLLLGVGLLALAGFTRKKANSYV